MKTLLKPAWRLEKRFSCSTFIRRVLSVALALHEFHYFFNTLNWIYEYFPFFILLRFILPPGTGFGKVEKFEINSDMFRFCAERWNPEKKYCVYFRNELKYNSKDQHGERRSIFLVREFPWKLDQGSLLRTDKWLSHSPPTDDRMTTFKESETKGKIVFSPPTPHFCDD